MIEQLISRVFYARNLAHFAHWRAKGDGSFAKHMALGEFYDGVIDTIDPLVEAYQGAYELIGAIPVPGEMQTDILKSLNPMRNGSKPIMTRSARVTAQLAI
jgi:hypothetical protein